MTQTDLPEYSHAIRWRTTRRAKRFFSDGLRSMIEERRSMSHP